MAIWEHGLLVIHKLVILQTHRHDLHCERIYVSPGPVMPDIKLYPGKIFQGSIYSWSFVLTNISCII